MTGCNLEDIEYGPEDNGHKYCRQNMTVTNLTVTAIYQEKGAGNPTILFDPIIVPAGLLNNSQKTTLMEYDHGYIGFALDRDKLPSQTADLAVDYLNNLYQDVTEKRITVLYGANGTAAVTKEDIYLTIPKRKKKTIKAFLEYEGPIEAPISKGQKLGQLNVYVSDILEKQIDLVSTENIKKSNIFSRLFKSLNYLVWGDV